MNPKELYNNDLSDTPEVHDNFEDAHTASIQQSMYDIRDLIIRDGGYVKGVTKDTDLDAIAKAAKNIQLAIKGKFVSKYILDEA